jgi:hypothetical protein
MLRVMKQKVKDGSADELSRQSSEDSSPGLSPSAPTDQTPVAEVPQSISIPSSQIPPSSNSSVSSDGLHIVAPLTRISDDETAYDGLRRVSVNEDSPRESSANESDKGSISRNTDAQKRKNDSELSRKVSDLDLEESASLNYASAASSTSKRRKIAPLPAAPQPGAPQPASSLRLLAMPEDSSALNALHTFVRMQIEVFAATPADMAQPAPGRKTPVKLHQVGLRCIHCRHMQSRDRIKRAVCYPSSVSRIYHSVSDMKFDHFNHCRGFSHDLRAKFQVLKEECKRRGEKKASGSSSSSTAQYYHDSACKLGLVDSNDKEGIFLAGHVCRQFPASVFVGVSDPKPHSKPPAASSTSAPTDTSSPCAILLSQGTVNPQVFPGGFPLFNAQMLAMYHTLQNYNGAFLPDLKLPLTSQSPSLFSVMDSTTALEPSKSSLTPQLNDQLRLLAVPEDSTALNPLHCFVRRNVEVFIATKDDVAAPSPGRRTRVRVGQVGIRCIHCARLPTKNRVKRAVCYPPSVSGIYHSVSNMKFDHFGNCKGLSPEARLEFASLKNSSNRRNSPSGNGNRGVTSSTAQYYEESAARLGLIDREGGIQFREQCHEANNLASGKGTATDGISALMIAATNPSVRAEFDRRKALMGNLGSSQTVASV